MSIYVKCIEPFSRVPLLNDESIQMYDDHNVKPHRGTTYGEVERVHLAELKLARKLGCDLIRVEKLETVEASL
jgi:hypothetical protein